MPAEVVTPGITEQSEADSEAQQVLVSPLLLTTHGDKRPTAMESRHGLQCLAICDASDPAPLLDFHHALPLARLHGLLIILT
jgi:hypothetical protein